jgi:hypothetical protein
MIFLNRAPLLLTVLIAACEYGEAATARQQCGKRPLLVNNGRSSQK